MAWYDPRTWIQQQIIRPAYRRVYQPYVSSYIQRVSAGVSATGATAQRYVQRYKPTVSYEVAAERRRKVVKRIRMVKKRIPEKEAIARAIIRTSPKGIIAMEAIRRMPDIKEKAIPLAKRIVALEKKTSPGYIAAGIVKEKLLPKLRAGYEIGTGKHIREEQKVLSAAEATRIRTGTELAPTLGFESREAMRAQMEEAGGLYEDPTVARYYGATRGVSEAYTPEVEAWYERVGAYQEISDPTEAQYQALMKTKPSGVVAFEAIHTPFIEKYPTTPDIVTRYEELSKPFLTGTGELKPSVGGYIALSEAEEAAYFALQAKEAKAREEWAPEYSRKDIYGAPFGEIAITGEKGTGKPFWYPTMEAGARVTEKLMKPVSRIPEEGKWGYVRAAPEFVAQFPEWLGSLPPSIELIGRQPRTSIASIPLGVGIVAGGFAREFHQTPEKAIGKLAAMVALPYVGKKISPFKYVKIPVPTGKGQIKTRYTFKGDIPPEVLKWQEMGVWGTGLGKVEPTRIPFLQKQTYMVPEAVTYRGVYFRTPTHATTPYLGKHFLVGRITGAPGTIRGWQIGQPKFELPVSYRVFTPVEAAATLPSMKASLRLEQQQLMTEAFYLQQRFGLRRGISKPLKLKDVKTFEGAPESFLRDVSGYMRKYRQDLVLYGSEAKAAQIARLKGEKGGIDPADLDFEVRTLAARMQEGIVLPKRLQSEYTLGRLGIPTWKTGLVRRLGEKTPGLTPEKMATDLAAIAKKHLGKESVQISYKPQWQMYSVEKIVGWEKTPLGKEAVVETLFDIHPESAGFEFGLKPIKPIKATIETGLDEGWWARHKKIRMTTLGEEFEHSFASIIQTQVKGGELYLAPRFKRLKDIPRFVQTGKMLSEFERLKIETGIMPLKKYRLKGIAKEEAALKHWEDYASSFKELKEYQTDMTAKAISTSAESVLKQQRIGASLFASETAALSPKRIKFEEAYKPEISKPRVGVGKEVTGDYYDVYGYPARPSGYYPAGYYGIPSYYGKPAYRAVPPSHKVFGFVPTPPIKHIPTPPPARVITPTTITAPPLRHIVTPPPTTPTITTIPPPPFTPVVIPPTTPTPPPTPPVVTTTLPPPPPFVITPPPPIIIPFIPFLDEDKKKPRKKKKFKHKEREWYERHYIPTVHELMRMPKGVEVVRPSMPELMEINVPKL